MIDNPLTRHGEPISLNMLFYEYASWKNVTENNVLIHMRLYEVV